MNRQFQFHIFIFLTLLLFIAKDVYGESLPKPPSYSEETVPLPKNPVETPAPALFDLQQPDFHFEEVAGEESHFMADFIKMLVTLGFIIAFLLFISWYLKRMMSSKVQHLNSSSLVKVIEQRQLSTRSTIHIVEIEGKTFAIGESAGNICLLTELTTTN